MFLSFNLPSLKPSRVLASPGRLLFSAHAASAFVAATDAPEAATAPSRPQGVFPPARGALTWCAIAVGFAVGIRLGMLQSWWILGAISFVSAVVAETLNIIVPEHIFIQWVLSSSP